MGRTSTGWGVVLALGLLAGCATERQPASPPQPIVRGEPMPPAGAARGLPVPEPEADGRFTTINSSLEAREAAWHLRAALNVAALSCPGKPAITQAYNRLLNDKKALLRDAYAAERERFGANEARSLDTHMTRLYNFFAQPPAQVPFCSAAAAEAERLAAVEPAAFLDYAGPALNRLEQPILAYYTAYNAYRHALASYQAGSAGAREMEQDNRSALAASPPAPDGSPASSLAGTKALSNWRIQIGAFTGKQAAKAAWARARVVAPRLAAYTPVYEHVPARRELVRLQVGSADDRESALRLCAIAAAGGFDCLPVARP